LFIAKTRKERIHPPARVRGEERRQGWEGGKDTQKILIIPTKEGERERELTTSLTQRHDTLPAFISASHF